MNEKDFKDLYILSFDGIGPKTLDKLNNAYNDNALSHLPGSGANASKESFQVWREKLENDLIKKDIHILKMGDDIYPYALSKIIDAPRFLFAKGNSDILKRDLFAVVGSRKPTPYGINVSNKFAKELAQKFVLVSGMALGIDSIAHKNSLENGTIAVLGGGLDYIYPSSNKKLHDEILANGGLILSEYFPHVVPMPGFFPQRSRIISGLSSGLLVTEAAAKSGSLIAANLAFDQGKNVYAIPGDITRDNSSGCNYLITQNIAKLVQNVEDILIDYGSSINLPSSIIKNLHPDSQKLVSILKLGISDIDEILAQTEWELQKFLQIVTSLEIQGVVSRASSDIYLNL